MFVNCQTLTLFKLLTPFFTFLTFTVKHPGRDGPKGKSWPFVQVGNWIHGTQNLTQNLERKILTVCASRAHRRWRCKSLLKDTCCVPVVYLLCTCCIYDSDVTKPLFLKNKFWPVICASRHRISISHQPAGNSFLPRFSFFLTTGNPHFSFYHQS